MRRRITRKLLEELAHAWAERHGKTYGREAGQVWLGDTDSRCAPYLYSLWDMKDGGGHATITEAMTAQMMCGYLLG